jgi:hypothetical protein
MPWPHLQPQLQQTNNHVTAITSTIAMARAITLAMAMSMGPTAVANAAGACAAAAVVAAAATVMQRHAATGIRSAVSAAGATEATTAQEASMVAIVAAIQALVLAAATGISVSSGSIGSGVCSHSSISGSNSGIGSGLHTILPANGVHTKEPELPHSASSLPSAKLYHTPLLPSCQW